MGVSYTFIFSHNFLESDMEKITKISYTHKIYII